jgi:hypothetical protein
MFGCQLKLSLYVSGRHVTNRLISAKTRANQYSGSSVLNWEDTNDQ